MVISMIGYKMDKVNINLLVSDHLKMDFQLIPEPIEMKEIHVSAKANTKEYKQWKKENPDKDAFQIINGVFNPINGFIQR